MAEAARQGTWFTQGKPSIRPALRFPTVAPPGPEPRGDMARLGQLALQQAHWDGRPVAPALDLAVAATTDAGSRSDAGRTGAVIRDRVLPAVRR